MPVLILFLLPSLPFKYALFILIDIQGQNVWDSMKKSLVAGFFIVFLAFLYGCDHGDNSLCENPIEFSNEADATTHGYLIGFEVSVSAESEAARLQEKYIDLEIYAIFPSSNGVHANSSDETLEHIRCESNIVSLTYNNAIFLPLSH